MEPSSSSSSLVSIYSSNSNSNTSLDYPTNTVRLAFSPLITAAYVIIYLPLWISIVLGNLLVIFAFIYKKEIRTVRNYLLLSLSVTDLLTGIVGLPANVLGRLVISQFSCYASTRFIFFLPGLVFCGSSVYHLLFIGIDR